MLNTLSCNYKIPIRSCSVYLLICFNSCIGAGTHGSIKKYDYKTPKYKLEKAVHDVIARGGTIHQDTIKNEYNDGIRYITLLITENTHSYQYTFRFYGGKEYWDTSKISAISISYAYNEKREGGSEGNGGVKRYNLKLRKELTLPFEREFISKIDKELGINHTEE